MAPATSWNLTESALYFKIFENIPLGRYTALSTVCKDWNHSLFEEKALWMPICETMLSPKAYEKLVADNNSPDFKAVVKAFFNENKARMELIVYSFTDDAQLRNCLHSKTLTLQEFKSKSSLDRSHLLWRALYTDATPILIALIQKEALLSSESRRSCTDIASCLIRDHQVPCNMVDVICSVFGASAHDIYNMVLNRIEPRIDSSEIAALIHNIKDIVLNCIRSHPDLSEIENRTYSAGWGGILRVKATLLDFCNGWIQQGKITQEDLIACKLVQKEENGNL